MTTTDNHEASQTREQIKKERKKAPQQEQAREPKKRIRVRLIPIWLRIIIVVVLIALSLMLGVFVGYGMIGGGNPADAFDKSTWTHILDFLKKE
nr:DNA-directed RNA polymerase subunit beta [Mesobacillus harenae]